MRSLVIGGSGFLGSHAVEALLRAGHEVDVLDLLPPRVKQKDVLYLQGDMTNPDHLSAAIKDCEYVFHYGTTTIPKTSIEDPFLDHQNLLAAVRILRACRARGVSKIVFASSGGTVYGTPDSLPIPEDAPLRPRSPYAKTKVEIENRLEEARRLYGQEYLILRYANPYGPLQDPHGKMGVVSIVLGLLRDGRAPTLYGDGTQTKDFVYATDAAEAAVEPLRHAGSAILNVGSGKGTSIRDLFSLMREGTGIDFAPRVAPPVAGDEPSCVLDIRRIRSHGWEPKVDLRTGLRLTWEWIQSLAKVTA